MKDADLEEKCAHHPCQCQPEPGSDYCGMACENAKPGETDCSCGHPDCRAEA